MFGSTISEFNPADASAPPGLSDADFGKMRTTLEATQDKEMLQSLVADLQDLRNSHDRGLHVDYVCWIPVVEARRQHAQISTL